MLSSRLRRSALAAATSKPSSSGRAAAGPAATTVLRSQQTYRVSTASSTQTLVTGGVRSFHQIRSTPSAPLLIAAAGLRGNCCRLWSGVVTPPPLQQQRQEEERERGHKWGGQGQVMLSTGSRAMSSSSGGDDKQQQQQQQQQQQEEEEEQQELKQEKIAWGQIAVVSVVLSVVVVGLGFTFMELNPFRVSPNTVFSAAFEAVQGDPDVTNHFGSPLTAHGREHGGHREGRRNFVEHEEFVAPEDGSERLRIRFHIKGAYSEGLVFAEVSKKMKGEWVYLMTQDLRSGHIICLHDKRAEIMAMAGANSEEEKGALSKLLGGGRW